MSELQENVGRHVCKKCHKRSRVMLQPYMKGMCNDCYRSSPEGQRADREARRFAVERFQRRKASGACPWCGDVSGENSAHDCPGPGDTDYLKPNPQLQILMNEDPALRDAKEGLREFHLNDELDGSNVKEWKTNDGSSRVITLYDGGQCPAVAWTHDECGSCKQHKLHIPAEGEDDQAVDVEWFGHRVKIDGARLGVDVRGRELCVVLGNHERLRRHEDEDGCLGYAPCCEYVPRLSRGKSGKGDYHYVHKFREISQPRLCWDDSIGGYRFKGGLYSVQEWVQD